MAALSIKDALLAVQGITEAQASAVLLQLVDGGFHADKDARGSFMHLDLADFPDMDAQQKAVIRAAKKMVELRCSGDMMDVPFVDYTVEPLSSAEFSFDTPIEPIVILPAPQQAGSPPLVHVVEKAQSDELPNACTELAKKFCALPHYDERLQFFVGVAIAGHVICFGRLLFNGGFAPARTFNIAHDVAQGMLCIRAAVNVGRWARHAVEGGLVAHVRLTIGETQRESRREITLLSEGVVVKKYLQLNQQQCEWLVHFYTRISGRRRHVRFMEWAQSHSLRGDIFKVELRPFGVVASSRLPSCLSELRAVLRWVLTCLCDLHGYGWAHLDVRWNNVVYMCLEEWVVIDAEFARPFGSEMPLGLTSGTLMRSTLMRPRTAMLSA